MSNLAPLTKLLFTVFVSLWAMGLQTSIFLTLLVLFLLISLASTRPSRTTWQAAFSLCGFAFLLGLLQYALGSPATALPTALKTLAMTLVFVLLFATTRLQDLTAALVKQCRIPQEYAFMFTAALRFVPDFLAEIRIVQEAQACRGYRLPRNPLKRISAYAAIVQPLVLRAIHRSDSMALSLELRGFSQRNRHSFHHSVTLHRLDYILLLLFLFISIAIYLKA